IAGQGTVGLEILRQHPDPIDAVFIPIGGGGLAAGVAAESRNPLASLTGLAKGGAERSSPGGEAHPLAPGRAAEAARRTR
ncbi:pyridoxal-phosphate dependent enzyme, partial [Klebsiella pneumoniae]|uniref:pyridoxal-phosphate dependent enzyme n=1 Tax=Klebsiella pneumoniae TaxID=573 RepID=UPI002730902E